MGCLLARDLERETFSSLIRGTVWPEEALVVAFSPARAVFDDHEGQREFAASSEQGRVFCDTGELKWRRVGELYRVVYLGAEPRVQGLDDHSRHLEGLRTEREALLLWGVRTDLEHEWIEQQVPQRFRYPIKGGSEPRGRVAIVVERWVEQSGLPRFSRYCGIKEVRGDEEDAKG